MKRSAWVVGLLGAVAAQGCGAPGPGSAMVDGGAIGDPDGAVIEPTDCAQVACVFVRAGATGDGSSWTAALGDLPEPMDGAATYFVAAGSYRSGEIEGTVKRATAADHGDGAGWDDAHAGAAVFAAPLIFAADATVFDGVTWEGFQLQTDAITGGCPACGAVRIAGEGVTLRHVLLAGDYGGSFGHSVALAGRDTTFEACHFVKTLYEDTFGGEPAGTLTLRGSVINMADPPDDGAHRDVFNPYTGVGGWSLVLEQNVFEQIWLFSFLLQQGDDLGSLTVRGNVFANGGGHVVRFGSGSGGAGAVTFAHNTFYNVIDYDGPTATHRDNVYAHASGWTDAFGGTTVHLGDSPSTSVTWTDAAGFANAGDVLGPDGRPWTADDGLRLALLEQGEGLSIAKVSGMCREMLTLRAAFFTFIDVERVDPTNNAAERAIRFAVLMRKGCFGSDSAKGRRFIERFLTARQTLRTQKRDLYGFLKDACAAALHGTPTPSLLPEHLRTDLRTDLPTAVAA